MVDAQLATSPVPVTRPGRRASHQADTPGTSTRTHEQAARSTIARFIESQNSLLGAVLATVDGLPIADFVPPPRSASKLGAMTSALLALCEAAARESDVGASRQMLIEGDEGRLIAMTVDFRGQACVVLAVACASESLGQSLWAARQCRDAIAAIS